MSLNKKILSNVESAIGDIPVETRDYVIFVNGNGLFTAEMVPTTEDVNIGNNVVRLSSITDAQDIPSKTGTNITNNTGQSIGTVDDPYNFYDTINKKILTILITRQLK